tara:strand:- start:576 stop:1205 length:630 start_codon:yes stop_codon:yes gene_type:complete
MFKKKKYIIELYIMASVSDYAFNNMSRIGNDNCDQSQRNIQNVAQADWTLSNHMSDSCTMSKGINFALSNGPGINYSGSHQTGIGGCQIDTNSDLLIDKIMKPACKISLLQRPFATVPYLGRGSVNPVLESQLMQGDLNINKKTVNHLTEKSYINYHHTPMIPSLAASITNPSNLIEGAAAEGWIRGGLPSRDLTKDQDYFTQHTKTQY